MKTEKRIEPRCSKKLCVGKSRAVQHLTKQSGNCANLNRRLSKRFWYTYFRRYLSLDRNEKVMKMSRFEKTVPACSEEEKQQLQQHLWVGNFRHTLREHKRGIKQPMNGCESIWKVPKWKKLHCPWYYSTFSFRRNRSSRLFSTSVDYLIVTWKVYWRQSKVWDSLGWTNFRWNPSRFYVRVYREGFKVKAARIVTKCGRW